jgi:hypothetical protein
LVELTANLIRVVRGAGKPELIADQLNSFAAAYNEYPKLVGRGTTPALLAELIQYRHPDWRLDDDRLDEVILEHAICRDALQIVASALVDQRTHRDRAIGELRTHLRAFEDLRKHPRARRRRGVHPRHIEPKPK